jgi:two-component system chemotaxis response regulator CheY
MKKVLAVDDSDTMLAQLSHALEEIGCEVITALSGQEGLAAAQNHNDIVFILVDIHMPGMNGLEMVKKIRDIPQHKNTMVMMCTAESAQEYKAQAKDLGVKCWITKPIIFDNFKKIMSQLLKTL